MKKSILLVMFALLSVAGFSQVSWNAKVGMNISNFTGDLDVSAKVGVKLGVGMEYAFNDTWFYYNLPYSYLRRGLSLVQLFLAMKLM